MHADKERRLIERLIIVNISADSLVIAQKEIINPYNRAAVPRRRRRRYGIASIMIQ